MKIKFSIIIPNYNKALYVEECIESVLNQTYKNFEIILIDDGSTDESVSLIKKYDVLLFHTPHLQAGGARNLGIEKASGDYIIFLDSDDYLTDNYVLEKLANLINDEDLIFLNYTRNEFGKISFIEEKEESLNFKIEKTRNLGCPTKCFKTNLIKDIKLPECKRYEDVAFTIEAMCKAEKYTYFKDSFFTYRRVENSNATSIIDGNAMLDVIEELVKLYRLCLKYPKYKENLLSRITNDKLYTRFDILNELIKTGKNTFYDYFK